ncbi:hypothetical protein BC831DRAFT_467113, partial [Entophlyctis helioformis]
MLSPRRLVRLLPLLLLQALLLVCAFMPPASLVCCRVPACMQLTMAANHDILLSWTHTACDCHLKPGPSTAFRVLDENQPPTNTTIVLGY